MRLIRTKASVPSGGGRFFYGPWQRRPRDGESDDEEQGNEHHLCLLWSGLRHPAEPGG